MEAGQAVTYTLAYANEGNLFARAILITDVVPAELTHIAYESSGAIITPTGAVSYTWQVANLGPGASGLITVTGVVRTDLALGDSFTNTAEVSALGMIAPTHDRDSVGLTVASAGPCYAQVARTGRTFGSADALALQTAVDAASAGDLVKVAGTCRGAESRAGTDQSVYISQTLTVQGGYTTTDYFAQPDPAANPTTLDAAGLGRVAFITGTAPVILADFTATNGRADGSGYECPGAGCGGGIYAAGGLTLLNLEVISNTSATYGGGVYAEGDAALLNLGVIRNTSTFGGGMYVFGALTLTDTVVTSNTAQDTGGGALAASGATVSGARFAGNQAGLEGGGLYVYGGLAVSESEFVGNAAGQIGGGVSVSGGATRVVNGLFTGNTAAGCGAAVCTYMDATATDVLFSTVVGPAAGGSAIQCDAGTLRVEDTIVASYTVPISAASGVNASEDHNVFYATDEPVGAVAHGGHSLKADPAFVDAAGGDYHLTANSAAIDVGADAGVYVDLDGNGRPRGSSYDAGAYESPFTHMPDVTIHQTVTPMVVEPGDAITCTLSFSNGGQRTAYGVTIRDVVPTGLRNADYTSSGAVVTPTGPISYTWQVADLAPGAGGLITVTAAVIPNPPHGGVFTNTATVTATGMITPTHDRDTVSVTLLVTPTLQVSKDVEPAQLKRGEVVTYTLRVTNTGNIDLHAAIRDVLPVEIETADPLTWTAEITKGGTWSAQVVGTVSPTATGAVANVVRVDTVEGASGIFTRTANSGVKLYLPLLVRGVSSAPDLVVRKVAATTSAVTVTIENAGTGPTGRTFWVDVSFDPSTRPPRLNQPWPTIAKHGIAWGVTKSLAAGERLTLVSSGSDPYYWGPATSSAPPYPSGAKAYVYVDSVDYSTTWGAVLESDEGNNTAGPVRVSAASALGAPAAAQPPRRRSPARAAVALRRRPPYRSAAPRTVTLRGCEPID